MALYCLTKRDKTERDKNISLYLKDVDLFAVLAFRLSVPLSPLQTA